MLVTKVRTKVSLSPRGPFQHHPEDPGQGHGAEMSHELTESPENTHTHKIEKRMGAMMNGREESRLSVRTPLPHIDLVAKMAAGSPPPIKSINW